MVYVDMGEFSVIRAPRRLKTSDLGPCLGLALYSDKRRLGGLAHVFPSEYDLIEDMIDHISCKGIKINSIDAKMAGSVDLIAARIVKRMMSDYDIRVVSEDVGGDKEGIFERSMILRATDGRVTVKRYDIERHVIGTLVL